MSETTLKLLDCVDKACSDGEWLTALKVLSLILSPECGLETNRLVSRDRIKQTTSSILHNVLDDSMIPSLHNNEVVKMLQSVQSYFITNADIMIDISWLYFSLELYEKSLELAQGALKLEAHNATALETFENVCCHLIDRWHFVMLNDLSRNKAYESALCEVIGQHEGHTNILDIGCGTGILSFLAAKRGSKVVGVEKSLLMCNIANSTLEDCYQKKLLLNKIDICNKMSTEIHSAKDEPKKFDMVVTEIFDAGLFGEGVVSTLLHAWEELLKHGDNQSVVIPGRATLFIEAIESTDIRKQSVLQRWDDGFDTGGLHVVSNIGMVESDPYTSIRLKELPSGYKCLTASRPLLTVDFNDAKNISAWHAGVSGSVDMAVTVPGTVDALVVWFELHLTDSVSVSTHMETGGCWEQAVFPVSRLQLNKVPASKQEFPLLGVNPGDQIGVLYRFSDDRLCVNAASLSCLKADSQSTHTLHNFPPPNQLLRHPLEWCRFSVHCLSDWEVAALNSRGYQTQLVSCLQQVAASMANSSASQFFQIGEGFSPLYVQALRLGFYQVIVLAHQDSHKALLWKLVQINDLDVGRIRTVEDCTQLDSLTTLANEMEVDEPSKSDVKDNAAVVFFDLVDHTGRLVENWSQKFYGVKSYLNRFGSQFVIPVRVDIWGVFIESECLMRQNRLVSNDNVLGYPVKQHINVYSTVNHPDLCMSSLTHRKLTQAFKMFTLDFTDATRDSHLREGEEEGSSHSLLNNLTASLKIPSTTAGRVDALVYWFDLHLSPSTHVSTLDYCHYWNQAAVILDRGQTVHPHTFHANFRLQNSTIFVSFVQ